MDDDEIDDHLPGLAGRVRRWLKCLVQWPRILNDFEPNGRFSKYISTRELTIEVLDKPDPVLEPKKQASLQSTLKAVVHHPSTVNKAREALREEAQRSSVKGWAKTALGDEKGSLDGEWETTFQGSSHSETILMCSTVRTRCV